LNSGPRGSIRFKNELDRKENTGIAWAIEHIEEVKHEGNHITAMLSYSDLIQLSAYAAVEYCGGPTMLFRMGRKDAEKESDVAPTERLPDI
jgi:catalase (peroxidase I)